jgi:hypothetical protein
MLYGYLHASYPAVEEIMCNFRWWLVMGALCCLEDMGQRVNFKNTSGWYGCDSGSNAASTRARKQAAKE